MPGVYRHSPRIIARTGVRDLIWRQPGFNAALPNNSIQGVLYAGAGFSLQQGVSPAVQIGDTFQVSNSSPNNFVPVVNSDGTVNLLSGGNTSRQSLTVRLFRRKSGTFDGPGTVWWNEVGPTWANAVILPTGSNQLLIRVPITPVVLQIPLYASSTEGDTLAFAVATGSLPPGLSIVAGQIVGTPTVVGVYNFTLSATDITGTSAVSPASSVSISDITVATNTSKSTKGGRHRGKMLLVLPFDPGQDMLSPAEVAQAQHMNALREQMQGVFSGNPAHLQAVVDQYTAEQQRISSMSAKDKQVEGLMKSLGELH